MARAAFDMRIVGFDPYLDAPRAAALGIELVADLPALLRPADVVSVHTPLTPATVGLLGADELAAMKPSAYLNHTSRGGVVDEQALATALRAGQLRAPGWTCWSRSRHRQTTPCYPWRTSSSPRTPPRRPKRRSAAPPSTSAPVCWPSSVASAPNGGVKPRSLPTLNPSCPSPLTGVGTV